MLDPNARLSLAYLFSPLSRGIGKDSTDSTLFLSLRLFLDINICSLYRVKSILTIAYDVLLRWTNLLIGW
jgi:hypothetical protein